MVTFSYNPEQVMDGGLNQMRFELGDCLVEQAEKTAYLSDQEITVILGQSWTWKRKKLALIETLLMRFAYEVTQEVREAKWELSDRIDTWERLRKRLRAEVDSEVLGTFGFSGSKHRAPIFRVGMSDNVYQA